MKKLNFKIRPATKKDKGILVDFRYKVDAQEHSKNPLHPMQHMPDLESYVGSCLRARDYFFFVAEVDGKPVGFSAATIGRHGRTKKRRGVFEAIWVEPEYRRMGIGKALSQARLKKLQEYKPEKISVYVHPSNKASKKNIESLGGIHIQNVYAFDVRKCKR